MSLYISFALAVRCVNRGSLLALPRHLQITLSAATLRMCSSASLDFLLIERPWRDTLLQLRKNSWPMLWHTWSSASQLHFYNEGTSCTYSWMLAKHFWEIFGDMCLKGLLYLECFDSWAIMWHNNRKWPTHSYRQLEELNLFHFAVLISMDTVESMHHASWSTSHFEALGQRSGPLPRWGLSLWLGRTWVPRMRLKVTERMECLQATRPCMFCTWLVRIATCSNWVFVA